MSEYHNPVLLEESVSALITNPEGIYIDATFGGGGHSRRILESLGPKGRLIAFDRDSDAAANVPDDPRITFIRNNFRFVHNYVLLDAWKQAARDFREHSVDGILADLGVSSHQFDTAERGFSFRFDSPLDMRMNVGARKTAADVVNSYAEEDLKRIFALYGEIPEAGKMARLIIKARQDSPIVTTGDFNAAIKSVTPSFAEHKFLAKVYQALRIEVNDEMRSLEKFLEGAAASLRKGGRLVVITYHSLEDRMVKNFIRSGNAEGTVTKDIYGNSSAPLKAAGQKMTVPTEEEIKENTRARSAKLRIAEKV